MRALKIIQAGENWVVVDKPAGFHTHAPEDPSIRIAPRWDAQRLLRQQTGRDYSPAHRLDRATSGLLLFAHGKPAQSFLQMQFARVEVEKLYFALVRGDLREQLAIDRPLAAESGEGQPALTRVAPLCQFALPLPHPRGGERIFTLVAAAPRTGRYHQIRRHLAGLSLPLVGDNRHGDKRLNRAFAALTGLEGLFLRCMELRFTPPGAEAKIKVQAGWPGIWHRLFEQAGICPLRASPFPEP